MLVQVQSGAGKSIFYESFVGQSLQGGTGFGYNDEERMSQIMDARTAAASSGSTLLMNFASILKVLFAFAQFSKCDI